MAEEGLTFGQNFAGDALLKDLTVRYGTPLMVYDRRLLMDRMNLLEKAFDWNRGFRQYIPVKDIPNRELLRAVVETGNGLLCSNAASLEAAHLAGARSEHLLFMSCFPTQADWEAAARYKASVILDSPEQLAHVDPQRIMDLGLRVRPDETLRLSGIPGSFRRSKFGMTRQEVLDTAKEASKRGFSKVGLYLQVAGNVEQNGYFAEEARFLMELSSEMKRMVAVPWCNLGGGLAGGCDLVQESKAIRRVSRGRMSFHMESGRFAVAPAGMLLTSVLGIKRQKLTILGIDASMAELPKMCMPGVRYRVSLLGAQPDQERFTYHLAGPILDPGDIFGGRFILPEVKEGDILAFHNVGLQSASMASNYGCTLRCPLVVLDGDNYSLVVPGQTREQWLRQCGFPVGGQSQKDETDV